MKITRLVGFLLALALSIGNNVWAMESSKQELLARVQDFCEQKNPEFAVGRQLYIDLNDHQECKNLVYLVDLAFKFHKRYPSDHSEIKALILLMRIEMVLIQDDPADVTELCEEVQAFILAHGCSETYVKMLLGSALANLKMFKAS